MESGTWTIENGKRRFIPRNFRPTEMTPPHHSMELKHRTEGGTIYIRLEYTTGKLIEKHEIPLAKKWKAKRILDRLEQRCKRFLIPRFTPPFSFEDMAIIRIRPYDHKAPAAWLAEEDFLKRVGV